MAIAALDAVARETTLLAGVGFLIGGIDDLLIDLTFVGLRVRAALLRRFARRGTRLPPRTVGDLPPRPTARRIVVFVPAWKEAEVIGAMLTAALARFEYPDYAIYVGAYPNDPATIAAVDKVVVRDARVRLVVGDRPGGTTKADCLNTLWRALLRDEAEGGKRAEAIVLHDAEDVVHAAELRVFDAMLDDHAVVQIPVLPLIARSSLFISGHYADEFAESHGKDLVVRRALGAGLPLAGVGCAIARDALEAVAASRDGTPFDSTSLTEDYELGLLLSERMSRAAFVRLRERPGGALVAVRAYFPAMFRPAVRQKARWMIGIALAGWDRIGWSPTRGWLEHWMRLRDRRAPAAILMMAVAYLAFASTLLSMAAHTLTDLPRPRLGDELWLMLRINTALLVWRLAMRALFTGRDHGPVQAFLSVPRVLFANVIAMAAVQRALFQYVGMLLGAAPRWDKTTHVFPDAAALPEA
jgi:bacteriophage N4 adsorption protein B